MLSIFTYTVPDTSILRSWRHIREAQFIRPGTVADLLMASGRIYRAVWDYRGRCCAWWPQSGNRAQPIGLYEPGAFSVLACGVVITDHERGSSVPLREVPAYA